MSAKGESDDWASEEFGTAALGDARLTQRLVALARRLAQSPQCSFPQSLDGAQLKAAYRFFDNPRIDTDGVLVNHIGQTLKRMQQVPVVLAPQDTTEFNSTLCICRRRRDWATARAVMCTALCCTACWP
ncbi:IS4/Tn5 family transposase DNA-binding protein [Paraburkholderia aspalathi]|uniref:IS4/Tn5 family transposase DNA-binding protein n=1 Tax=Paraburkholderia aspalathi TaxID=1324617 RepID=UPI001F2D0E12|nr:transposase DNA-binding-containing protein [Paraburkholderia aspalathi]